MAKEQRDFSPQGEVEAKCDEGTTRFGEKQEERRKEGEKIAKFFLI